MKIIHGDINLIGLRLDRLPDLSDVIVDGSVYAFKNRLTDLVGSPSEIRGQYEISSNGLTSLKGCPRALQSINISDNRLTSLEGLPEEIDGHVYCDRNHISTLRGFPKRIWGNLRFTGNSVHFTEEEIRAVCQIDGYVSLGY